MSYPNGFQGGVPFLKAVAPSNTNPEYQADTTSGYDYTGQHTGAQYSNDYGNDDVLVHKLADQVIPIIRQQSYMRQFFRTIDMPTLQFNVPKLTQGADVFFVNEAAPTPFTNVQTGSVTLVAKKLMTSLTMSSELTQDNIVPIMPHIKRDIAKAFALAEEECFLYGKIDPTTAIVGSTHWGSILGGGARAVDKTTTAAANESGWFVNDKRLAFDGLSVMAEPGTVAGSPGTPATKIDAQGRELGIQDVSRGIESLGLFGRDKEQLLLIISLREERTLRADPTILTTLDRFGPSATFLTGEIGKIFGVSCIATNLISTTMGTTYTDSGDPTTANSVNVAASYSEAFLINRNALLLGDRRLFTLKASDIPFMLADQLLMVATERISMASQYREAMVKIENISVTD